MTMPSLACSPRLRRTPFSSRVEAAGVKAYTVYNHTLLPSVFRSLEEDYRHLKSAVQVWDVACERQVEIVGPDALRLVQMTTPRDLSKMSDDQCYYVPMVDARGGMLNDPVLVRLEADRYWVSLADGDMLYYFMGLAQGFGLDVRVFEPDVSPLAIQGPLADALVERVFGRAVVSTRFFRHTTVTVDGKAMVIARSGWSMQGGFEIYLDGTEHGEPLWDLLFEAGEDLDVRAGGPNGIERIEGGLLSYGSDMTREHTPFEAGLGKYCQLDTALECLGHAALVAGGEPRHHVRPLAIDGDAVPPLGVPWPLRNPTGRAVGRVTSAAWSPDFGANVAIGTVLAEDAEPGTELLVDAPHGTRSVEVRERFWIGSAPRPRAAA